MKTLIALGADVNQRNGFNLTALDVVEFMLQSNPNHPKMSQIIKDVGGVSGRDGPPQQQPAGDHQMDTGEEQTSKGVSLSLSLFHTHTHTHTHKVGEFPELTTLYAYTLV